MLQKCVESDSGNLHVMQPYNRLCANSEKGKLNVCTVVL